MLGNFVEYGLGALILSWVHYLNCPPPHFKSNKATIILHLYLFGLLFPSIHKAL